MKTETEPIAYHTLYGKLYVAVTVAKDDDYYENGQGTVNVLRPRLWVSSNQDFQSDPQCPEHWTIRGRKYVVRRSFYFHDQTHIVYSNGSNAGRWHWEHDYVGDGYVTDKGRKVEALSATYNRIEDEVTGTLDRFAEDHPRWGELSLYLTHRNRMLNHMRQAADYRTSAAKEEAKASALNDVMVPLYDGLPSGLAQLIK